MEFGSKIIHQRKDRGLTQDQLAPELGVTRQTLSRWENNLSKPDVDCLGKMATLFGVSTDFFLSDPQKQPSLPDYMIHGFDKQKKASIFLIVFSSLLILGFIAMVVYACLFLNVALIVVASIGIICFSFFLLMAISRLSFLITVLRTSETGDKKGFLEWSLRRYAHALPWAKETSLANLATAYLEADDLTKSRECFKMLKNPVLLDIYSLPRIELLLDEGKFVEAKGIYLSFSSRNRNGKSEIQRHTVIALDGLFHKLGEEPVSVEEATDATSLLDSPLEKRLLASAPWKKEKRQGSDVALVESAATLSATLPALNAYDAIVGQNGRKKQPWLDLALIGCLLSLIVFFLIACLSVPLKDPKPLRNMWVMSFPSFFGLSCIVFGAITRKKEPKNHTLPIIIVGSIVMTLAFFLALTALS